MANLTTVATKTPDGKHYIVNGEKKWITNGTFADYFTVAVRTGEKGMGGISMLLIERTMPGVRTRQMKCSGMWGSGTAYHILLTLLLILCLLFSFDGIKIRHLRRREGTSRELNWRREPRIHVHHVQLQPRKVWTCSAGHSFRTRLLRRSIPLCHEEKDLWQEAH